MLGTILYQKNIQDEAATAKFSLLSRDLKEEYRSLKIGDYLINHVVTRAAENGKTLLKIDVVNILGNLIDYYRERGFVETGKVSEFPRKGCLKDEYINQIRLLELQREIGTKSIHA